MPAANKDTLIRLLTMMQMIPLHPRWITARSIHEGLNLRGYDVTRRTIERDLNKFSTLLGLITEDSPEGNKWSYSQSTNLTFLPAISTAEALSLKMVQHHLSHHLPPFLFSNMQAMFNKADTVLQKNETLQLWLDKVAVVPPGIPIRPHTNNPDVLATLYRGLLEDRKVKIRYRNQQRDHTVSILGLIVRDNKLIFVCRYENFTDPRMILAHRVRSAVLLEDKHKEMFDLQRYAKSGEPGSTLSNQDITLEMEVKGYVKVLLGESAIGKHQSIRVVDDQWSSVTVTLPHSLELEHWLLAHIHDIKIINPANVRQRVVNKLTAGLEKNK